MIIFVAKFTLDDSFDLGGVAAQLVSQFTVIGRRRQSACPVGFRLEKLIHTRHTTSMLDEFSKR